MSRFHTYVKSESSSESEEEGELVDTNEDNEDIETVLDTNEAKEAMIDSKALKASKSLQIMDKIGTKRQNRFSIWSDILLEEELNQSVVNSMDIKKRRLDSTKLNRNSENYSFWTKRQFEDNSDDKRTDISDINSIKSKPKKKKKNKKKRNEKKSEKRIDIAVEMADKLNEPKVQLLRRVVQTIGEQKASELCSAALDVESAGGLMTADGNRRRTSGGVFFHLLKNDANVTKESIDFIFFNEQQVFRNQKKLKRRAKRRQIKKLNKKTIGLTVSETKCDINSDKTIAESETQENSLEFMPISPKTVQ